MRWRRFRARNFLRDSFMRTVALPFARTLNRLRAILPTRAVPLSPRAARSFSLKRRWRVTLMTFFTPARVAFSGAGLKRRATPMAVAGGVVARRREGGGLFGFSRGRRAGAGPAASAGPAAPST